MSKKQKTGVLRGRHAAKLKAGFRASMQGDTLELLVYEDIGPDYWSGDGVTAKTVKQQLDDAGSFNRIAVRINSPGGDAFEGSAILSLLRAQKKPVDVFVDGIAASAASLIAMAGDTITMGRTAMMMVHNPWTWCVGNAADMRQSADVLDKIGASMAQAYVDKTGKTAAEIKTILDAETWMSAEECVSEGFATAVAAAGEDDDAAMALARSFKSLAKMKKVPEVLKAADRVCSCDCEACVDGNCAECDMEGCHDADCAAAGCPVGASVDDSNLSQYEARLKLLRV
jgi:ATP-dependent protease ClpP protease subunit